MDILYNPNFVYVLLVLGSVLTLLSILTPGTGLLEVGALFLLAFSGFAVYRIGFNLWALIVLVLAFLPFIYSIRKPKREWALGLSILALIAGSLYMFPSGSWLPAVNPFLAVPVSLLVAIFLWWSTRKVTAAHHAHPLQDLQVLIGQSGEARTLVQEEGSVQVAGELWSARSEQAIPAGSRVRVIGREGFTLLVTPDDQAGR